MRLKLCRVTLVFLSIIFFSGCQGTLSYTYFPPDGQLAPNVQTPEALSGLAGTASVNLLSYRKEYFKASGDTWRSPDQKRVDEERDKAIEVEVQSWLGEGEDLRVEIRQENSKRKYTAGLHLLTLGVAPARDIFSGETVLEIKSGDQVIFQNRVPYKHQSSLAWTNVDKGSTNFDEVFRLMTQDQLNRHKLALGQQLAASMPAYETARKANTAEAYRGFLKEHSSSIFRMDVLNRLVELAPSRNATVFHKTNYEIDPVYLSVLPVGDALWFIGPEGMRVHDVLSLSAGQEDVLLATRIKAAKQPYKVFDNSEIQRLKAGGLSDTLIAAMIEVTANPVSAATGSTAGAIQPALAAPAPGTDPSQGSTDPTVGDIAAQCAKRYAAMKACDQVPGFGANICRGQVKKKYSHIACELIQ